MESGDSQSSERSDLPGSNVVRVSEPCAVLIEGTKTLASLVAKVLRQPAKPDDSGIAQLLSSEFQDVRLFTEMMLCRGVDNYLTYISELLMLIYRSCPETMKSKETVTFETILSHSDYDDLLRAISEEKVLSLSYKGYAELNEYLRDRMHFPIVVNEQSLLVATHLIETRNIIVHNSGIVNKVFLKKVPSYKGELGSRIDLDPLTTLMQIGILVGFAVTTDERAAEKYKIPTRERNFDPIRIAARV